MARKAMFLIALVLAVAALAPTSALAKAKGTDRPTKGTFSGTSTRDLSTGTFFADRTGNNTQLGRVTTHSEGTFAPVGSVVVFSGTYTTVAANGDKITGTIQGTSTHASLTGELEATAVATITGGTGRFEDASGQSTITQHSVLVSFVGALLVTKDTGTATGTISY